MVLARARKWLFLLATVAWLPATATINCRPWDLRIVGYPYYDDVVVVDDYGYYDYGYYDDYGFDFWY
jgi:hypothetical protein